MKAMAECGAIRICTAYMADFILLAAFYLSAYLGIGEQWSKMERRILLQIRSTIKSGVEFANALWAGI